MIQLSGLLWGMAIIFGVMGFMRGLSRELISMAGIILGLFALFQFDSVLRGGLLATFPPDQKFYIQTIIFLVIVFFAYQTRGLRREVSRQDGVRFEGRDNLQASVLGAIAGFFNGYLIWGSIWYFMDINAYPLNPYITPPLPGSPSAQFVNSLPLYVLTGPDSSGNLLALAVIVLFVFVLVII